MVATIDPTTGLPLLTSDLIGQIPLDSQVFPYDDLNAVDRPPRGPMYPDDILPTTSIVTGMDQRNPQKVQTVETDGEHALRVFVVNPSSGGGGGTSWPADATPAYKVGGSISGIGYTDMIRCDSIGSLYYVNWYFYVRPALMSGGSQEWAVILIYEAQAHGVETMIAGGFFVDDGSTSASQSGSILFPGGLGNMNNGSQLEVTAYHDGGMTFGCGIVGSNIVNPH